MFWNDLKDIKSAMDVLVDRFLQMDERVLGISQDKRDIDECNSESLDRLHDKLTTLLNDSKRIHQVDRAEIIMDKFDDYMKNVHKLNEMVNEFKGCVSIARAAIAEKKEVEDMCEVLKKMIKTCQDYFAYQKSIGDQYFKIDAIYKALCEKEEKPKKKRPPRKKKVTPPSAE